MNASVERQPLTVGIDITRVGEFGIGIYTKNLVVSLSRVAPENRYVLLGGDANLEKLGALPENFQLARYERPYRDPRRHFDYGMAVRALGLDVFHMPFGWIPALMPRPYVCTLHDLNNVLGPAQGLGLEEGSIYGPVTEYLLRRGLRRAARILAVSNATKRDAVQRIGRDANDITVIHDAVDEQVAQPVSEQERRTALARFSIDKPFVLYAGRIQPHKNVPRLIEAFAVVKSQLENHPKYQGMKLLVIGDDLAEYPDVRHAVMRTRIVDSVRFLGFLPVETLRVFYSAAEAFLFPSLYEGFGMPPLEAMAHGAPVVTSNVSSLPEAVGDAAVLVQPSHVFDIARGLRRVLVDEPLRQELRRKGFEQVKKFSWDRSAERVAEVYRAVVRENSEQG